MKAALFRKDGIGAVVGRLKSPNEIQYEDNGSIKIFQLTGNVLETEYNDVLLLGKKISDTVFEVQKMESLPHKQEEILGFKAMGNDGPAYCLAIPVDKLTNVEEKISERQSTYHIMHFTLDNNTTMYLTILGEWQKDPANECYVFILTQPMTSEEHSFGSGYAIKRRVTKYAIGNQVMS